MTAKEKAKALVSKYSNISVELFDIDKWSNRVVINKGLLTEESAKQCAIITVKEQIKYAETFGDLTELDIKEFNEVINEIEKL